MTTQLHKNELFIMVSNIFLVLPVFFAALYQEWFYLFFASGIFIFSPIFHWYRIVNTRSPFYTLFRVLDWLFALIAFVYMYYYTSFKIQAEYQNIFYIFLSAVIVFFFYGWRYGNYIKLHPWFHILAPLISTALLISAHYSTFLI